MCVCVCACERERECVCVCVCVCERERESMYVYNIYIQGIGFNAQSTMRVYLCARCQHLSANKHLKLNLLKSRNQGQ